MPSIISIASLCYSKHSDLFFKSSSQTGEHQCAPLGPLLFSLDFWPLIDDIESKLPNLLQHCWYLDDGIIAGTEIELCKALEILSKLEEKFGLELRKDKGELWSIKFGTNGQKFLNHLGTNLIWRVNKFLFLINNDNSDNRFCNLS